MPGNWHVRFGGGPYGKGPANCGYLAVRPTQSLGKSARHADRPVRAQPRRPGRGLSGAARGTWPGHSPYVRLMTCANT